MGGNVINIKIIADNLASGPIDAVKKSMSALSGVGDKLVPPLKKVGSALGNVATIASGIIVANVFTKIADGLSGLVTSSIDMASSFEQNMISFTTMLGGSADKAKKLLDEIATAAATTPFELPELESASKSLLAFGIASDQVVPTLIRLGDVSAGIGAPIGEISQIYGKARTQGRLFAEDINQLTGRGIPIIGELAKQFGVAESSVKKLVEDGKVGFKNLEQAFISMTGEGSQFGGLMEAQSQSLAGIQSNISDTIGLIGRELLMNTGIFDGIKEGANNFLTLLQNNKENIQNFITTFIEGIRRLGDIVMPIFRALVPLIRDYLVSAFSALANLVQTHVVPIIERLRPTFESLIGVIFEVAQKVMPILNEIFKFFIEEVLPPIMPILEFIITAFAKVAEVLLQLLAPALELIFSIFKAIWPIIAGILTNAFNIIKPIFEFVVNFIKAVIIPALQVFAKVWTAIFNGVADVVKGVFGGISNIIKGVVNGIIDILNGIGDAINRAIDSVAGVADTLGIDISFRMPKINRLALGGDFVTSGPQLIMVGDNPGGQERVQVTPMSSPNINGPQSGGEVVINQTFNNTNVDANAVAQSIMFNLKYA